MTIPKIGAFTFNRKQAADEASSFLGFLGTAAAPLAERKHLEPEFDKRLQMIAGYFFSAVFNPDRVGTRVAIGDFACGYLIADSQRQSVMLVEIENADADSVFRKSDRFTTHWGNRLEAGFGQIVDWVHALQEDIGRGHSMKHYGFEVESVTGLMVVGLNKYVSKYDQGRLRWRGDKVVVAGCPVRVETFDNFAAQVLSAMQ